MLHTFRGAPGKETAPTYSLRIRLETSFLYLLLCTRILLGDCIFHIEKISKVEYFTINTLGVHFSMPLFNNGRTSTILEYSERREFWLRGVIGHIGQMRDKQLSSNRKLGVKSTFCSLMPLFTTAADIITVGKRKGLSNSLNICSFRYCKS